VRLGVSPGCHAATDGLDGLGTIGNGIRVTCVELDVVAVGVPAAGLVKSRGAVCRADRAGGGTAGGGARAGGGGWRDGVAPDGPDAAVLAALDSGRCAGRPGVSTPADGRRGGAAAGVVAGDSGAGL